LARCADFTALVTTPQLKPYWQENPDGTRMEMSGFPGVAGSSAPKVAVPLEVTLEKIWPERPNWLRDVEFEVVVRNKGKEAIQVPTSTNYAAILTRQNKDMVSGYVGLRIVSSEGVISEAIVPMGWFLTGSKDAAGSSQVLGPNQTISFRTKIQLWSGQGEQTWARGIGPEGVTVKMSAVFWTGIVNDQLGLLQTSTTISSKNVIETTILK
jgi:hypothetical protein